MRRRTAERRARLLADGSRQQPLPAHRVLQRDLEQQEGLGREAFALLGVQRQPVVQTRCQQRTDSTGCDDRRPGRRLERGERLRGLLQQHGAAQIDRMHLEQQRRIEHVGAWPGLRRHCARTGRPQRLCCGVLDTVVGIPLRGKPAAAVRCGLAHAFLPLPRRYAAARALAMVL